MCPCVHITRTPEKQTDGLVQAARSITQTPDSIYRRRAIKPATTSRPPATAARLS